MVDDMLVTLCEDLVSISSEAQNIVPKHDLPLEVFLGGKPCMALTASA
jgi:hypothetical protein